MFKAIHGIAPTYLSDRIVMHFDVNGYDTRGSDMDLYLPTLRKEVYRYSFMYMVANYGVICLSSYKILPNIESFKHNYRMYKRITSSWQNRHLGFWQSVSFCMRLWKFPYYLKIPLCTWIWIFVFYQAWDEVAFYVIYVSLLFMIRIYILKVIHMFYF